MASFTSDKNRSVKVPGRQKVMVKLFPVLTSLPFYYSLIKRVTSYLTIVSSGLFIVSRTPRTEKFRAYIFALGLQVSECFDKMPVRILFDVLSRVFRFFLSVF